MKRYLAGCAAVAALVIGATTASARPQIYSFETGPDNAPDAFFGLGASVARSTIGATSGPSSMRYAAGNDGFVGAHTESVAAGLDPNNDNIIGIAFDLTINPGEVFAGGFANIGVTLFGHGDPDGIPGNGDEQFGLQYQVVSASERNIALQPGTYSIEVPLVGQNPMTFVTQTYADAFGDGPNQLFAVSAFQLFISKSGGFPATVYIDNVRTVEVPEPASIAVAGIAGGLMLARRRRVA